jgi:histone H3/H4
MIIFQARVKKIIKLDPEVKNVSKESLVTIAKATELFVAYLAMRAAASASARGAKSLKDTDIINGIHGTENLSFLSMDFPIAASTNSNLAKNATVKKNVVVSTGSASIQSYFGGKKAAVAVSSVGDERVQGLEDALEE